MATRKKQSKKIARREKMVILAKKIAKQIIKEYPYYCDRSEITSLVDDIMNVELFVKD